MGHEKTGHKQCEETPVHHRVGESLLTQLLLSLYDYSFYLYDWDIILTRLVRKFLEEPFIFPKHMDYIITNEM